MSMSRHGLRPPLPTVDGRRLRVGPLAPGSLRVLDQLAAAAEHASLADLHRLRAALSVLRAKPNRYRGRPTEPGTVLARARAFAWDRTHLRLVR